MKHGTVPSAPREAHVTLPEPLERGVKFDEGRSKG